MGLVKWPFGTCSRCFEISSMMINGITAWPISSNIILFSASPLQDWPWWNTKNQVPGEKFGRCFLQAHPVVSSCQKSPILRSLGSASFCWEPSESQRQRSCTSCHVVGVFLTYILIVSSTRVGVESRIPIKSSSKELSWIHYIVFIYFGGGY